MEAKIKAKYIFVDPGIRNLGVLIIGFVNNKVQLANRTIDCSSGRFQEITELDKYVSEIEKPFYFFVETNYFRENPEITKKINTTIGALQFFLIDRYKLGAKDIIFHEKPAKAVAQFYGLIGDRQWKKSVINQAFHLTFKAREVTNHEADAFAAGACIILQDSSIEVEKDLRELAEIFQENVRKISQSDNPKNNERYADSERWLRSWRSKKRTTQMLADVNEPTQYTVHSFQELP